MLAQSLPLQDYYDIFIGGQDEEDDSPPMMLVAVKSENWRGEPRDEHGRWVGAARGVKAVRRAADGPRIDGYEDRSAITSYRSSSFVNDTLRRDLPLDEDEKQQIETLDRLMLPLKRDAVLHRGITGLDLSGGDPEHLVGAILEDKGYSSTAASPEFVQRWLGKNSLSSARSTHPGTWMRIHAPAGTKALSMHRLKEAPEGEVVLPKGAKFKVTKARYFKNIPWGEQPGPGDEFGFDAGHNRNRKGQLVLDVEVLPS